MGIEAGILETYSSGVDVVLDSGQDVALAGNVETISESLVDGSLVLGNDAGNNLHLSGRNL